MKRPGKQYPRFNEQRCYVMIVMEGITYWAMNLPKEEAQRHYSSEFDVIRLNLSPLLAEAFPFSELEKIRYLVTEAFPRAAISVIPADNHKLLPAGMRHKIGLRD